MVGKTQGLRGRVRRQSGAVQASPWLESTRFQILIGEKDTQCFQLEPGFLSSRHYSKVVTMKGLSSEQKRDTVRALLIEAGVSARLRHPGIVAFVDIIFEEHRIICLQECCQGGTLLAVVQKTVDRKRAEKKASERPGSARPNGRAPQPAL